MHDLDEELDEVLQFQAHVGQRRHGHFDHDSHGMTGPMTKVKKQQSTSNDIKRLDGENGVYEGLTIRLKRMPVTGEILRA